MSYILELLVENATEKMALILLWIAMYLLYCLVE